MPLARMAAAMLVPLLLLALRTPLIALPAAGGGGDGAVLEHFSGSLLGVRADVRLDRRRRRAFIELRGAVFAGRAAGVARFASGTFAAKSGSDNVVIEEPLRSILARRFVKICRANYDERTDQVEVVARLPVPLGSHRILLSRVASDRAPGE